jgi:hypothetical protein
VFIVSVAKEAVDKGAPIDEPTLRDITARRFNKKYAEVPRNEERRYGFR